MSFLQTKKLIKILQISIFAAVATVLTFFELPVFFAPSFYKLDFSNVVVLISGFSIGPLAGVLTEFLKVLLKILIKGSTTVGLGDLASFVAGVALTLPSAACYKKYRTFKGACVAMLLGTICLTAVSAILNYFILLPAYEILFSISENTIISLGNTINPLIFDRFTFILFIVCPFNLFKGALICSVTLILYKRLSVVINNLFKDFVK